MKRLFYLLNVPAAYAVVSGALFGPLSADIRLLQWAVPLEHNRLDNTAGAPTFDANTTTAVTTPTGISNNGWLGDPETTTVATAQTTFVEVPDLHEDGNGSRLSSPRESVGIRSGSAIVITAIPVASQQQQAMTGPMSTATPGTDDGSAEKANENTGPAVVMENGNGAQSDSSATHTITITTTTPVLGIGNGIWSGANNNDFLPASMMDWPTSVDYMEDLRSPRGYHRYWGWPSSTPIPTISPPLPSSSSSYARQAHENTMANAAAAAAATATVTLGLVQTRTCDIEDADVMPPENSTATQGDNTHPGSSSSSSSSRISMPLPLPTWEGYV